MMKKRRGTCLLLMIALGLVLPTALPAGETLDELREAHARVRDLVMEVERREVDEDELKRLKRSASSVLQFSRLKLYFKAPDCLRMEGRRGLVPLTMIGNGNIQV